MMMQSQMFSSLKLHIMMQFQMSSSLKLHMMLPEVCLSLKLHMVMQSLMSSSTYILKPYIVIVLQYQVSYPYCPNLPILSMSISHISHLIFDHSIKMGGSTISKMIGMQIIPFASFRCARYSLSSQIISSEVDCSQKRLTNNLSYFASQQLNCFESHIHFGFVFSTLGTKKITLQNFTLKKKLFSWSDIQNEILKITSYEILRSIVVTIKTKGEFS
ncbi:hypothetical protein PR048_011567 [Dryococelus australis]|uniref:Uncharacterized protein n=1 Tax=Dryococelus australis TaxID=614101 RepID=A0ABQ9HMG2_9NEOP|nr:hypothetical protein PR048_011567 [Dryococelus australis]